MTTPPQTRLAEINIAPLFRMVFEGSPDNQGHGHRTTVHNEHVWQSQGGEPGKAELFVYGIPGRVRLQQYRPEVRSLLVYCRMNHPNQMGSLQ